MPRFEPFRALRYDHSSPSDLRAVMAPPYDVLSEADRAELAARHRHNIVHVDVPVESDGPGRYDAAARTLRDWIDRGVVHLDPSPSFTIYRMDFNDEAGNRRRTSGVIGALEVVDEGAGGVLPHERTTPKAKTDRLDLTRATRANLSPVWGLSLTPGLTALLDAPGEPMGSVEFDGVVHTFERVSEPERVAAIAQAVGSHDVVIADGHHRYAISRTFRDEERLAGRTVDTTMTYVGELIAEQLSVDAIHRLYSAITFADLRAALARSFDIEPLGSVTPAATATMRDRGALVLVAPDRTGELLVPRPAAFEGVRDLDGARLEHALADVSHDVAYQHGVGNVTDIVAARGAVTAGVLIRPVSVAEIRRTADEGLLMPPKSTFFTPKLRTGPVIRPVDAT
ncbi:MAG: hypothetical protein B7C54_08125 [Acidimicrobiales bacterium mtb01]|nr:DUF1015 domain-containing protein [Actinomycetota bacterium]TEX45081.1 MAG: hypothetical protein B7C54_08125 [Acidimicrobiales bacterium mtb01]